MAYCFHCLGSEPSLDVFHHLFHRFVKGTGGQKEFGNQTFSFDPIHFLLGLLDFRLAISTLFEASTARIVTQDQFVYFSSVWTSSDFIVFYGCLLSLLVIPTQLDGWTIGTAGMIGKFNIVLSHLDLSKTNIAFAIVECKIAIAARTLLLLLTAQFQRWSSW